MEELLEENINVGFYTASILQWKHLLKPDKYKDIILSSLQYMVDESRAKIYAFVIMPNHIHLLWRILPPWNLKEVQRDFMKFTGQMIKYNYHSCLMLSPILQSRPYLLVGVFTNKHHNEKCP